MRQLDRIKSEIFRNPISATIEWRRVEGYLVALGCILHEGAGSRVAFIYGEHKVFFHRPHPNKEAKRYQVKEIREFLEKIGVKP